MNKKLSLLLSCLCLVLLTGCMPDIFHRKADYTLSGIDGNKDLKDEVKSFLSDRAGTINIKKDSEPEQQRQLQEDLRAKLASEGYYDAAVSFKGDKPWHGTYDVKPGPLYTIRKITVIPASFAKFLEPSLVNQPLQAKAVLAAEARLHAAIANGRCYFNLVVDHEVTLDQRTKSSDIVFHVTAGPEAQMGALSFIGNEKVKTAYLQKLADWKEGSCFTREKVEAVRTALFETGLFSGADVTLPETPAPDGRVPVTLRVTERARRSLSAGLSYYTDEGPGLTLGWKHRNLLGQAESLDTSLDLSRKKSILDAKFTKPFFMRRDQSLSLNGSVGREETDAYTQSGFDTGVALSRIFHKRLTGSTGINLSLSRIKDVATLDTNTYYLLSFPQSLTFDNRDNALDATKGFLFTGKVEPFLNIAGTSSPFLKAEGAAQAYLALNKKTTAAARFKLGSIVGAGALDIPATQRFYAGGGGSVRGFAYQKVGPQKNGEPQGGRSLVETSGELRYKITDTVGAVAFVDAGSVGTGPVIDFNHLSVGAGVGMRYYTDFGPLRMDVATPLTDRATAESAYQIYISIGQSF